MSKKNILLLSGGGSTEHDISLVSVKHIEKSLSNFSDFNLISLVIEKNGNWVNSKGDIFLLDSKRNLTSLSHPDQKIQIDYAIPCIHGFPGETGDIQSVFEMMKLPYLGCNSETSKTCFNKITTKLWATALGVATTPYMILSELSEELLIKAKDFQKENGDIVVKASNQGSSVGCYLVQSSEDPTDKIKEAFGLSPYVLIEKRLFPRELEVSVYEFKGLLQISFPGEIICPSKFYSFEEKYSQESKTYTEVRAKDLTPDHIQTIKDFSKKLAIGLKLKDLSRIDFFLDNNQIFLNEINTFPGLTPISMFPKMMEANGHLFKDYLYDRINR